MTATDFFHAYSAERRIGYALLAILFAVLLAGFWNFRFIDEFGTEVVAGNIIGDTTALAGDYALRGSTFGLFFAAIAGLAATFTACNCVVFAMLPGLTCSVDGASSKGSALGAFMLLWGIVEMGFAEKLVRVVPESVRSALGGTKSKAAILGVLVGLFAVGRPFLVFREFLVYAASANNPLYGAIAMMIQGLGQIALMAVLFFVILYFAKNKISAVANNAPWKFRLVSAVALIAGGTYFIYYWGLSLAFDVGQWGFKLGWYT